MSERLSLAGLALLALLSLWLAPWAAFNRETGSRAALLLLPDRIIDFTGRTDPIGVDGNVTLLLVLAVTLLLVAVAALLPARWRDGGWLLLGALLLLSVQWGMGNFRAAVHEQRVVALQQVLAPVIADPGPNRDGERLRQVSAEAPTRSIEASVALAREAGFVVRRLPYGGSAPGLAVFTTTLTGLFAVLFGLRVWPAYRRWLPLALRAVAVPSISIALALLAAAVVILVLQETPMGRDVVVAGPLMALAGRLDVVWHALYVLFNTSLGSAKGFLDALAFSTPLIFTGLAVGFGFRAGLFNIGAPGQMVLGSIFAMLAGLYIPGPTLLVLPLAIAAAALGGALWGAIPGFLKARYGANEVINTILLNFVAASLLLFLLSSSPTFAAAAVRVLQWLGVTLVTLLLLWWLPPWRRLLVRAPRVVLALVAVVVLVGAVVLVQPRAGDTPVVVNLPFKVPGSEPKSYELNATARLPRVPALFGIDTRATPGTNVVPVDVTIPVAVLAAFSTFALLGLLQRRLSTRLRAAAAFAAGMMAFSLAWALGWRALPVPIPTTNLNPSFLLALLAAAFVWVFLFRSRFGYELRAAGLAPKAAEYAGVNLPRNTVMAMAISGALAGLTATHYVLGGALEDYALRQAIPTSDGFDGIAVALLGANHPLGTVLAAFLFGVLKNGGAMLNIAYTGITRDVVSMVLALVVLFIAARGFLPKTFGRAALAPLDGAGQAPPATAPTPAQVPPTEEAR